jgi:hypothetical protein
MVDGCHDEGLVTGSVPLIAGLTGADSWNQRLRWAVMGRESRWFVLADP